MNNLTTGSSKTVRMNDKTASRSVLKSSRVPSGDDSEEESDEGESVDFDVMFKLLEAKKAKEQNSTSTTISRKLEEYADASLKRVQDLVQETQQMMQEINQEIDRFREDDTEEDWKSVCVMFGGRSQEVQSLIESYDVVLELEGAQMTKLIHVARTAVDGYPARRVKSRKRLMKRAQHHLEAGTQQQKDATDAQRLIEHYHSLLRK